MRETSRGKLRATYHFPVPKSHILLGLGATTVKCDVIYPSNDTLMYSIPYISHRPLTSSLYSDGGDSYEEEDFISSKIAEVKRKHTERNIAKKKKVNPTGVKPIDKLKSGTM